MAKKAAKAKLWVPKSMCKALDLDMPGTVEDLARLAVVENPRNAPFFQAPIDGVVPPGFVALLTGKWWKAEKKRFTFAFMTAPKSGVPQRIAAFANAWNKHSAIEFAHTADVNSADFRIAFEADGYWSYLGIDCASIPKNQQTMNLQGMNSTAFSEKEGLRVIPHEFGHAVGMPHEHTRAKIIARLDAAKTIKVFRRDQGWNETTVRQQILTPLSESAIFGTDPDETSIMCYWFTGECTKDGRPIVGGSDLSELDKQFAAKTWPKATVPPPVEPPTIGEDIPFSMVLGGKPYSGKVRAA